MQGGISLVVLLVDGLHGVLQHLVEYLRASLVRETGDHQRSRAVSVGSLEVRVELQKEVHEELHPVEDGQVN